MPRAPRKSQWNRATKKCEGRCWYCGITPEEITVDHAKPRSRGGNNSDDNLLPSCRYCNNLKGDRTISEFRKCVKVLVCRGWMSLGYGATDLSKIKIIFYGEGNPTPFAF